MNANLLRSKMAENGVNQTWLAHYIGISENSLSRKMLGKRQFRLDEVVNICSALHIVEPRDIFFDDIDPNMQR